MTGPFEPFENHTLGIKEPTEADLTSEEKANPKFSFIKTPPLKSIPGGQSEKVKDSPPKRNTRSGKQGGTPKPPPGPYKPGVIADGLTGSYVKIGMFWGMFDPHCGEAIVQNAEKMAQAADRIAKNSPKVRVFLEGLIATSEWGELVEAYLPVAAAIAVHHVPAIRRRFYQPATPQTDSGIGVA